MGSGISIRHLLFAVLAAAFITFYPQLDAAGYCGDACPEVSYPAQGVGEASGGAGGAGVSFVVAALVLSSALVSGRAAAQAALLPEPEDLVGLAFPPEVPPPRPSA